MKQVVKYKKNKAGQIIAAYHYQVDDDGKGVLHNERGPAVVEYDGRGGVTHEYWFINGARLTNSEIFAIKRQSNELTYMPSSRLKNE